MDTSMGTSMKLLNPFDWMAHTYCLSMSFCVLDMSRIGRDS